LVVDMAARVLKAGDTMVGHLTLPTGPAADNAVRKDYVDAAFQPKDAQLFAGIPINAQSGAYTLVATDAQKGIVQSGTQDLTIPADAAVAFPLGTCVTFVNRNAANISVAINSDIMYLAGTTTTGTRTLAANGMATAVKVAATIWIISGTGLT